MADPQGACCDLELNADITGIGVRAALYAQILLGWFMSLIWPDTFVKNARTAYMTATALIIASFIQLETQDSDLSLLDGIVVSLITTMMITFSIASKPPRGSNGPSSSTAAEEQKSVTRGFMQFCFTGFWAAWSFNLWRNPARFGLKGDRTNCPTNFGVTLSVFGREIHATDPGMRTAALVLLSIGFLIAVVSMFFSLEQVMGPILRRLEKPDSTNPTAPRTPLYDNPILQNIHTVLQCLAFGTLIYLIVATEKTILRNDLEKKAAEWSYGQTIALILLLQQLMDVFSTWVEKSEGNDDDDSGKASNPILPMNNLPSQPAQPTQDSATSGSPPTAPGTSATAPDSSTQAQAPASQTPEQMTDAQIAAAKASDPSR